MKQFPLKSTLTAALVLAITLTFSCSSGGGSSGGGGGDDDPSSSSGVSSSSSGGGSSSSGDATASSSSSSDIAASSSSVESGASSSSVVNIASGSSSSLDVSTVASSSSAVVITSSSSSAPCTSWNETVTKAATCTEAGSKKLTCASNAADTKTEVIPQLEWGNWVITTPATSTTHAAGYRPCPNGDRDDKDDLTICGTDPTNEYSPTEQFCQDGTTVKTKCGGNTYSAAQECCGNLTVGTIYNPATQFCQNVTNEVKDLCGTATYTKDEFCTRSTTNPPRVVPLCGGKGYDTRTKFCDSRDGKLYKFVTIGSGATAQTWMAENLNYNASGSKCGSVLTGSGTVGDANTATCDTYGRLYNWATAMANSASSTANPSGVQGVCPPDWHLPSDAEWGALMQFVNPSCTPTGNCADAGTKLKATSGWNSNGNNGNGTDDFGFSALPGGRGISNGNFYDVGLGGHWWSATEYNANNAYYRYMYYSYEEVSRSSGGSKSDLLYSVRCLQD